MAKQKQQDEDIYRQAMEVVDDDVRWTGKKKLGTARTRHHEAVHLNDDV